MYPPDYGDAGVPTYEDVQPGPPWHAEPHTRPAASLRLTEPPPTPRRRPPWLAICTLLAACLCLGTTVAIAIAWTTAQDTINRQSGQINRQSGQIAQLRRDANAPAEMARQANAKLAGRVAGTESRLAPLTAYGANVCSLPVSGSKGPVQAYFRCSYSPSGG